MNELLTYKSICETPDKISMKQCSSISTFPRKMRLKPQE